MRRMHSPDRPSKTSVDLVPRKGRKQMGHGHQETRCGNLRQLASRAPPFLAVSFALHVMSRYHRARPCPSDLRSVSRNAGPFSPNAGPPPPTVSVNPGPKSASISGLSADNLMLLVSS